MYVAEPETVTNPEEGLIVQESVGTTAAATVTAVHDELQLFVSSLSVMTPVLPADDLSAQARTYQVPAEGNV